MMRNLYSDPAVDLCILLFIAGALIGLLIGFCWAGKDNVSRRIEEDGSSYYIAGEIPETQNPITGKD